MEWRRPTLVNTSRAKAIELDASILTGTTFELTNNNDKSTTHTHRHARFDDAVSKASLWTVHEGDQQATQLLVELRKDLNDLTNWTQFLNYLEDQQYSEEELRVWYDRAIENMSIRQHRKKYDFLKIAMKWALSYQEEDIEEVRSRFMFISENGIGSDYSELYLQRAAIEVSLGNNRKAKKILRRGINRNIPDVELLQSQFHLIDDGDVSSQSISKITFGSTMPSLTSSQGFAEREELFKSDSDKSKTGRLSGEYSTSQSNRSTVIEEEKKEAANEDLIPSLKKREQNPSKSKVPVSKIQGKADASSQKVTMHAFCKRLVKRTFAVNGKPYADLVQIGSGGSGQVYKVISHKGQIYALKCVKVSTNQKLKEELENEIQLLERLKGKPNIIQLVDYELKQKKGILLMVFEYGETDLRNFLKNAQNLNINAVKTVWQQMLEAVQTIHEERIVHTDLKPANFILVEGRVKLIDFGIAKAIQNDTIHIRRDAQIGTINYMSPESFKVSEGSAEDTYKLGRTSDIWSLGCILYQMIYGKTPFQDIRNLVKPCFIVDPKYDIDFPACPQSENVVHVLKSCLQRKPELRPTIPELLNHPFLKEPSSVSQIQNLLGILQSRGLLDSTIDSESLSLVRYLTK